MSEFAQNTEETTESFTSEAGVPMLRHILGEGALAGEKVEVDWDAWREVMPEAA